MKVLLVIGLGYLAACLSCRGEAPVLKWEPLGEPGSGGWLTSITVDPNDPNHLILAGDMLGAGVSVDGGKKWQAATGFSSWEMAAATFSPADAKEIWMGTMSGPYVSHDRGFTWEPRRQGFIPVSPNYYSAPIQKIWIDPRNPKRLLAFGGSWRRWGSSGGDHLGTIWESLDDGKNWQEYSKIKKIRYTLSVAWSVAKPGIFFAVVDEKGLFKSTDDGKTWQPLTNQLPPSGLNMVAVDPTNPDLVWVSSDCRKDPEGKKFIPGGIYKSEDGGATWSLRVKGLPQRSTDNNNLSSNFSPLVISPSNPQILYTSGGSWDEPGIWRSDDGGETWQQKFSLQDHQKQPTAYPAGMGATVLTIDPHDPNIVYAAGSESVIVTRDGGKTWSDITSEALADDPRHWMGHGFSGLCSINIKFNPFKADDCVLLAMDAGRYIRSQDGHKTWTFANQGFDWAWGGGCDIAFTGKDGKILYGAFGQDGGSGNIAKSTDGGETWTMCGANPESGLPPKNHGTATSVYALPDQPDKVWAVYDGQLYQTTNGGIKWIPLPQVKDSVKIVADPKKPQHFFVERKDGMAETTDGQVFTPVVGCPGGVHGFALDPNDPEVLWLTTNSGLIKLAGGKAEVIKDDPAAYDVTLDPTNAQRIALATSDNPFHDISQATGVWLSDDGGNTWSQQNEGLACLRGRTIAFNPHHPEELIFGTFGRGYFVTKWPNLK